MNQELYVINVFSDFFPFHLGCIKQKCVLWFLSISSRVYQTKMCSVVSFHFIYDVSAKKCVLLFLSISSMIYQPKNVMQLNRPWKCDTNWINQKKCDARKNVFCGFFPFHLFFALFWLFFPLFFTKMFRWFLHHFGPLHYYLYIFYYFVHYFWPFFALFFGLIGSGTFMSPPV